MDINSSVDPEGITLEDISSPIEKMLKNDANPFTDMTKANRVNRFKNVIIKKLKLLFFIINSDNKKYSDNKINELHMSLKIIRYILFDRIKEIIRIVARRSKSV